MRRSAISVLTVLALGAGTGGQVYASEDDGHSPVSPDKILELERQIVEVGDFPADGLILAIGGGGESVIGQLKGERVVAIDISRRELEEAPGDALKIVMDARDLKFLEGTFDVAASFFTLMYVDESDHRAVFDEVLRVLQPGGRFLVWDAALEPSSDPGKSVVVVPLTVKLPAREIRTGYGVAFPSQVQDLAYYKRLALESRFEVATEHAEQHWFHIVFRKPQS